MRTATMLALISLACGAVAWCDDPEPPRVTLQVQNMTAADVAAEIAKQSGLQVAVTAKTDAVVSLDVKEVPVEEAVAELAKACDGSYLRAYIIEKSGPYLYSADQYIAGLQNMREGWMDSLSDEERQALFAQWREVWRQRQPGTGQPGQVGEALTGGAQPGATGQTGSAGQPPAAPAGAAPGGELGAAPAGGPAPQQGAVAVPGVAGGQGAVGGPGGPGAPGGPGGLGGFGGFGGFGGRGPGGFFGGGDRLYDPLRQLRSPVLNEKVTLQLGGVPLLKALYSLITASGYTVLYEQGLDGTVTVNAEDTPVDKVVEDIAACVSGKARVFYLVSQPKPLSEAEAQAMQEAAEARQWARFWNKTPQERAAEIQRRVEGIERMAARNPERFQRRGQRMLSRLTTYSATLSPAQRMELKPLMQAIGRALNQR